MITFDKLPEPIRKAMEEYKEESEDLVSLDTLKVMKKVMNLCFGEDNNQIKKPDFSEMIATLVARHGEGWLLTQNKSSIKTNLKAYCGISVVIRFPEITITNTSKRSHKIVDLWVKFMMMQNGIISPGLTGLRTTVSKEEFISRYAHSHLRPFIPENIGWESFCLGEGPIIMVMARLRTAFTEVDFQLLCMHIKNYVKWESLEGMPHYKMEYVGAAGGNSRTITYEPELSNIITAIKTEFVGNLPELAKLLKVTVTDKKIIVEKTEELETTIVDIIKSWDNLSEISRYFSRGITGDSLLCRKTPDGEYVSNQVNTGERTDIHQKTPVLNFKGQDIYFKVLNLENETSTEKYPSPEITEGLCKQFSDEFTKAAIRGEIFKEEDTPNNNFTATERDFLSM